MPRSPRPLIFLLLVCVLGLAACATPHRETAAWRPVWSPALQLVETRNLPPPPGLSGRALRQEIRLAQGGDALRVTISNLFGETPLEIRSALLAPALGQGKIVDTGALRATFSGREAAVIQPGQSLTSDPLRFSAAAFERISITLILGATPGRITGQTGARTSTYLFAAEHAHDHQPPAAHDRLERWYLLAQVEARSDVEARAIVVLGDSIAGGRGSTTDGNDRWPDQFAERLAETRPDLVVLNKGIGGNAVLRGGLGPTALERFERDVLGVSGARYLVLHAGVNDLGAGANAGELITGQREILRRARERGLRVFGATLLPFGGSDYDRPGHEAQRQAFNRWVREGGEFDAFIDFDAALRDPQQPERLGSAYDSGDRLHPSPAGYRRMAEAVSMSLFAP